MRILIIWGKEEKLFNELFPRKKNNFFQDRTKELEFILKELKK